MADGCVVCGQEKHPAAYACKRCKKVIDRFEGRIGPDGRPRRPDRNARIRALHNAWDQVSGCFRCFYTGVALVEDDWRDHRYVTLEHRTPGDESSIVVTSALVNRMKTDLSEDEFRRMITALAFHFAGEDFDECAFPEGKGPATPTDSG
jgi:hypothetical protein